ncbi:hypothetical protein P3G55_03375 [Leptospira sp. 96542]|nr:hypothetical protein [Leptospira sp. 96542]
MNQILKVFVSFLFLVATLNNCIGDLYFDTKNELDPSKVTRNEAFRKFTAAVVLKKAICPEASESLLVLAGYNTTEQALSCKSTAMTKKTQKALQSCDSFYGYVEKRNLDVCIREVLLIPCEPLIEGRGNTNFQLNFPVCRGLFGPGSSSGGSM